LSLPSSYRAIVTTNIAPKEIFDLLYRVHQCNDTKPYCIHLAANSLLLRNERVLTFQPSTVANARNVRLSVIQLCGLRLKHDGTRADTRFRLSAKRTNPFKSAWASVQSTAGSRGVRISGSNAGYTKLRGSVKSTGYPFHSPVSPSLPLSCVNVCHHISTGLYPHYSHCVIWQVVSTAFILSEMSINNHSVTPYYLHNSTV